MENPQLNETFNDQIRTRTVNMSVNINGLLGQKKIPYLNRPHVIQLIRSSSSVAANTRAATRARSDAEFYSKICVVVEECDETQFWLEYLIRINVLSKAEAAEIKTEVDRLLGLFTSIKRKMKQRIGGGKKE